MRNPSCYGCSFTTRRSNTQGFVLITVLGMIIVISLVAAFIDTYATQRLHQAEGVRQSWESRLDQQATLATILHTVATRPRGAQGYIFELNKMSADSLVSSSQHQLAADGRAYHGIGKSGFSVQDEGALLSLLDPNRQRWQLLLSRYGLTSAESERFLDLLLDYTDKDKLRRLNGATDDDYVARGMMLPRHRLMVSPGEIGNLLDADKWEEWLPSVQMLSTTRSGQLLNINTMPAPLLATLDGFDDDLIARMVLLRQEKPFSSIEDANQRLGKLLPLDPSMVPGIISIYSRVMIWDQSNGSDCRHQKWIGISLSPSSKHAPWDIDYAITFDHGPDCGMLRPLLAAPLFSTPVAG